MRTGSLAVRPASLLWKHSGVPSNRGLALTGQEEEWLRVRGHLRENRHLLAAAAAECYPADARLAGTPLLTAPAWRPAAPIPLEQVALAFAPEPMPDRGYAPALPERADGTRYASYSHAMRELDAPAVFENRPVYRLAGADLAAGRPALAFGIGRYFDLIDTGTAAAHEFAAGQAPSVRAAIGDPCDLSARPVVMAVATLTVRLDRAAGTARFPLHWRDPAKVGHAGGMYMVVPAGIFQPSGEAAWNVLSDFDLWKCMVREYAEELLGEDEDHGSERAPIDYDAWPLARRMAAEREAGRIRAWCVGLGTDPLTFATDLLTVAVFDAPVYDELFSAIVSDNAEGTVLALRDLDEPTITELITGHPAGPGGSRSQVSGGSKGGGAPLRGAGVQAAGAALLALALRHRDVLLK
jgi:hypothetical protein